MCAHASYTKWVWQLECSLMARQTRDSSASGWDIGLRLLYRDCPDQIGTVGRYDIDRRDCVLCQFVESVTFALCAFIFALRNIALGGFFLRPLEEWADMQLRSTNVLHPYCRRRPLSLTTLLWHGYAAE